MLTSMVDAASGRVRAAEEIDFLELGRTLEDVAEVRFEAVLEVVISGVLLTIAE